MQDNIVQEIKSKLDIVDIIGEYITLTKAGSNYRALSPFRSERTPSFMVNPELQIFKDFGGDKVGDMFTFIMEIEGVNFREALQILADKAGVRLENNSYNKKNTTEDNKQDLFKIINFASKFYQKILSHEKYGEIARQYIQSRGISPEMVKKFEIGFALNNFESITKALLSKKVNQNSLLESGISLKSQNGKVYDRFRGRIMIPIKDSLGRPVGFTGRVLPEFDDKKMGKYINSPQSKLFDKGSLLFGLSESKLAIKEKDRVVLVEGQMDVIMSHQAGVIETIGVSGTALTEKHIKIINRYTKNYLLAFDNDEAGLNACIRSTKLILKHGGIVKVIPINTGKDTADIVLNSPSEWGYMASEAIDFMDYYIEYITQNADTKNPIISEKILLQGVDFIQDILNKSQQDIYVRKFADKLNLSEKTIYSLLKNTNTKFVVSKPKESPMLKLQRLIIGYTLFNSKNNDILELESFVFNNDLLRTIFTKIIKILSEDKSITFDKISNQLIEEEKKELENIYFEVQKEIQENNFTQDDISQTLLESINLLKSHFKRSVINSLRKQLKESKLNNDNEKVKEILNKIQIISSK